MLCCISWCVTGLLPVLADASAACAQVMSMVGGALIERFGPYAGWAHNTLFIAELSSHKVRRFSETPALKAQPMCGVAYDDAPATRG